MRIMRIWFWCCSGGVGLDRGGSRMGPNVRPGKHAADSTRDAAGGSPSLGRGWCGADNKRRRSGRRDRQTD